MHMLCAFTAHKIACIQQRSMSHSRPHPTTTCLTFMHSSRSVLQDLAQELVHSLCPPPVPHRMPPQHVFSAVEAGIRLQVHAECQPAAVHSSSSSSRRSLAALLALSTCCHILTFAKAHVNPSPGEMSGQAAKVKGLFQLPNNSIVCPSTP
jgi:hypothetical protein